MEAEKFRTIFAATVRSVGIGALWTVPFGAALFICTEPNSSFQQCEKYYRDGYMDAFPSDASSDTVRMIICNSTLDHIEGADDLMECTTIVSTVRTQQSSVTLFPRNPAPSLITPLTSAVIYGLCFALLYPFTILVCSFPFLLFRCSLIIY